MLNNKQSDRILEYFDKICKIIVLLTIYIIKNKKSNNNREKK